MSGDEEQPPPPEPSFDKHFKRFSDLVDDGPGALQEEMRLRELATGRWATEESVQRDRVAAASANAYSGTFGPDQVVVQPPAEIEGREHYPTDQEIAAQEMFYQQEADAKMWRMVEKEEQELRQLNLEVQAGVVDPQTATTLGCAPLGQIDCLGKIQI